MLCNLLLYLIILLVLVNPFGETWFIFFLLKGRCGPGVTQLELLQNLGMGKFMFFKYICCYIIVLIIIKMCKFIQNVAHFTLVYEETNFSELWKNKMEFLRSSYTY